jgi:hypothetical protein
MTVGTIVGYAENISAGWHKITVSVYPIQVTLGSGDVPKAFTGTVTGGRGQTWTLEAEEVQIS